MADLRIKDVAPITSTKNADLLPISIGDDNAHTIKMQTIKEFCGGGDWNTIANKPTFSAVATSGSYNDLTDKPTIPSDVVRKPGIATFKEGDVLSIEDNYIINGEGKITNLNIGKVGNCIVGSSIYFTAGDNCVITVPTSLTKIGDFSRLVPNAKYVISVQNNTIAIAKEGQIDNRMDFDILKEKEVDIKLQPNHYYKCSEEVTNLVISGLSESYTPSIVEVNIVSTLQITIPNNLFVTEDVSKLPVGRHMLIFLRDNLIIKSFLNKK